MRKKVTVSDLKSEVKYCQPFDLSIFKRLNWDADRTDLSGLSSLFDVVGRDANRHKYQTLTIICTIEGLITLSRHATVTHRIVKDLAICIATASKETWKKLGYDFIGNNDTIVKGIMDD